MYIAIHILNNPIEQHNILTIHVNYIKNNILEKKTKKQKNKKNKYIITAKQVKNMEEIIYRKKIVIQHYIIVPHD